ncbi:MAG: PEP-CTERM sorting domain-containing protein [Pirellula sp.]
MTSKPSILSLALLGFSTLLLSNNPSYGQKVWRGGTPEQSIFGTPEWTVTDNWQPNVAPTSIETATFNATSGANTLVTFFGGGVANSISIASDAASHTFGSPTNPQSVNNAGAVTIGGTGLNASISNASSNSQTFVSRVDFNTASNTRTISNSGLGNLTFEATSSVNASTGSLAINNNGTGFINFNGGVTAGQIEVGGNGQVRFSSSVSGPVASSGRLDGTGSISGALTLNNGAVYSPGAGAIGNQVIGSSVALNQNELIVNSGSVFEFDLNSTASDSINLSNRNLNLAATGGQLTVRLNLLSAVNVNPLFSWDIFTNVANAASVDLSRLGIDFVGGNLTGSANTINNFAWSQSGSSLRITAVPEPSSMALLGMAGLIGGVYARRRAKKNKA